jgi:hypothetical protein
MFVKRDKKSTFEDTFKEAIKMENDMLSLKGNPGSDLEKYKSTKKNILLTKPSIDREDQDFMDIESLQSIINKLSNEIVDIFIAQFVLVQILRQVRKLA